MKRPSIFHGICFAFAAAILAIPLWWGLTGLAAGFGAHGVSTVYRLHSYSWVGRAALGLVELAYLGYLLRIRRSRVGSVTLAAVNLVLTIAMAWAPLPVGTTAALLGVVTWVNRSLLFHRSAKALVLDAGLTTVSLLFAGHLFQESGSFAAGIWGYLLLQSVWVLIPRSPGKSLHEAPAEADPFACSRRQAEAALERLVQAGPR